MCLVLWLLFYHFVMTCIVSLYTQHSNYLLKLFAALLPNCKYSAGRKSVYISTLSLQYTHNVLTSVTFTFSSCDFYRKCQNRAPVLFILLSWCCLVAVSSTWHDTV